MNTIKVIVPLALLIVSLHSLAETITTKTADGVTIYGETYFGDLPGSATLVLLFHQGGSNGRGEYGGVIAPWLNENGFRVIAWDQRSGGKTYGSKNRTVDNLPRRTPNGFCEAYPDLEAALELAMKNYSADKVIVWGSSYSGALVYQLAAKYQNEISGVVGLSPASGGPLAECAARNYLDKVTAKSLLMRPTSEMERSSSQQQMEIFKEHGAQTEIIEQGIHGSSMLVDERTDHDMTAARNIVASWLKNGCAKISLYRRPGKSGKSYPQERLAQDTG